MAELLDIAPNHANVKLMVPLFINGYGWRAWNPLVALREYHPCHHNPPVKSLAKSIFLGDSSATTLLYRTIRRLATLRDSEI